MVNFIIKIVEESESESGSEPSISVKEKPRIKIAMKKRKKVVLAKKKDNSIKPVKSKLVNSNESDSFDGKINKINVIENNEVVKKVFNYLFYICKNINNFNLNTEKDPLIKLLVYLKELKIENPIQLPFLLNG